MKCEKVLGNLSLFLDEMLEENLAEGVGQHLQECPECGREWTRTLRQREALRSLPPLAAPEYLHDLVRIKIEQSRRDSWMHSLRSSFEYRWSKIKSTEGMWYISRLLGAMATIVLFVAISSAINPVFLSFTEPLPERVYWTRPLPSQTLVYNMQKKFGMPEAQKKPIRASKATLNDLYLYNLSETASRTRNDDTVSLVTLVDRNGAAKVQDILEYPADDSMLSDVTEMINSAGWRPATQNGRAVESRQVRIFSTIYVFN